MPDTRSLQRMLVPCLSLSLIAALAACSGKDPKADAQAPGKTLPVTALTVQPVTAPILIEAVGQTEGAKEVEVRARVGGLLMKRLYEEGAAVKAGQPLFEIDRAPLEAALASARASVSEARARVDQANREQARLKGLVAQDAASRKDLDDATSTAALNRAALEAAQAQEKTASLNLGYANVTAPVSGISGRAQKTEGNLITTSDSLLTSVVQVDPIKVRFAIGDLDAASVPGGRFDPRKVKGVQIELPDGSRFDAKGALDFAASQIDPKLGTRQLRASFANPQAAVLPGQFVKVRIEVGSRDGVFRVPQTAVLQTDQGFVVMTVGEGNTVAPRPVQTANWDGKDWIIVGGLKGGDRVIVDNLIKLKPGMPVMPLTPEQMKAMAAKMAKAGAAGKPGAGK
ncbi:efflux RND transporter periplasmic adaptor subunit [Niveibacterium terrae]|uniref:efflux RND transporter periplasmic adaptor subunit n=1 Tax=Niveibacterium terrae TaxID=3373598 RepID=UPI003A9409E0